MTFSLQTYFLRTPQEHLPYNPLACRVAPTRMEKLVSRPVITDLARIVAKLFYYYQRYS